MVTCSVTDWPTYSQAGAEGEYSQGETFWLAADSEPRCMLEQVARSIFAKHAAALGSYDPRRSGAEYWSLCIDADDDDVGLHWDKDFALEAEEGTNLTPAVATVTYLTGQGAPTIMLSRPPPSRLGEPLDDGAPISPSNPDATLTLTLTLTPSLSLALSLTLSLTLSLALSLALRPALRLALALALILTPTPTPALTLARRAHLARLPLSPGAGQAHRLRWPMAPRRANGPRPLRRTYG